MSIGNDRITTRSGLSIGLEGFELAVCTEIASKKNSVQRTMYLAGHPALLAPVMSKAERDDSTPLLLLLPEI